MSRAAIEAELLDWMARGHTEPDDARFERLALALFRHQVDHCPPYARYAESVGRTPDRVTRADDVPAVPTGAFKELELRGFPAERTIRSFRTSGTSTDRRGELHLDTLALYEASLLASLRDCLLRELAGQHPMLLWLAPSPSEAPESSLSHMFETLLRAEGGPGSGFHLRDGRLDLVALRQAIATARTEATPVVLGGTSFAFVHLLDAIGLDGNEDVAGSTTPSRRTDDTSSWALPSGSRVMETGGFKGRSREVAGDLLRAQLAHRFGVPETSVLNQYGMTELGSQFYDSTLVDPRGSRRKLSPPWARVRVLDPGTGRAVAPGEIGMLRIHDLANTGSVAAIQTADLGRVVAGQNGSLAGFEVLGRAAGAEERGCSLATDRMLDPDDEARR